ncbi:helix-turn-helix transcriptional regulator [Kitasatospora sp. NBC_00070]|uniref:helix-turn-helix domain-containing protein n=1 Tax=Kitasatospora sp. NBC_00070 TaxID=2975962 RepID=UPI00324CA16F
MPSPRELDPSESFAAFFGNEVRQWRTRAKLSQERLGDLIGYTGSLVGQVETGKRRATLEFAQEVDRHLEADGLFVRLWPHLGARRQFPDYFESYAKLEPIASEIRDYGGPFIPGLGQTDRYARHLFLTANRFTSDEEIEEKVSARIERQAILLGPTCPMLWWLVDEDALRRPMGGHGVMAEQLRHLSSLIRSRTAVVQVIPVKHGSHSLLGGAMALMSFHDSRPDVLYTEGPHSGLMQDDPDTVRKHAVSYDLARATALTSEASLSLIEQVAEEHGHHDRA